MNPWVIERGSKRIRQWVHDGEEACTCLNESASTYTTVFATDGFGQLSLLKQKMQPPYTSTTVYVD